MGDDGARLRWGRLRSSSAESSQHAGEALVKMASPPPHPATRRATAASYFETGLLLATAASIWIAVAAVLASAILDAIR
jgi:hypothetical protein